MATYTVAVSETGVQSQNEIQRNSRFYQSLTESNSQSENNVKVNLGNVLKDQSIGNEVVIAKGTFTIYVTESSIGVEGAVDYINRWDDPRNNFNTSVITPGPFVFHATPLLYLGDDSTQQELLTIWKNGILQ